MLLQLGRVLFGGSRAAVIDKGVGHVPAFRLVVGMAAFCGRLFLKCSAFCSVLLPATRPQDYPIRNPDILLLAVLLNNAVSLVKPARLLQHPLELHSESPLLQLASDQLYDILDER